MLEVDSLTSRYGAVEALRSVSIQVQPSEVVMIVGPNGAGKSTLLRSIMGVHKDQVGEVRFEGRTLTGLAPNVRHKMGISWIPEGRGIVAELTVEENLDLARFSGRWHPEHRVKSLDSFPILARALGRPAAQLSGGEQQMLALARAWETAPRLMILDEPSLGLAPVMVDRVLEALALLRSTGVAMLVVEQRARGMLEFSDRVALMSDGRVREASGDEARIAELTFETYLGMDQS